jgi:tetratricopeptide (TPR) repeat protein
MKGMRSAVSSGGFLCRGGHSRSGGLRKAAVCSSLVLLAVLLLLAAGVGCSSLPKDAEPQGEVAGRAEKFIERGNSLYRQARFPEALEMYRSALESYIRIDDLAGSARAQNAVGTVYQVLGRRREAEQQFERALETVMQIEEPAGRSAAGVAAEALANLAEIAYEAQEIERAFRYIERGLALVNAKEYPGETAVLLHNRAVFHKAEERYTEAETNLLRALELNRGEDRFAEMATNLYMLGALEMRREAPGQARERLQRALELDRRTENSVGIAHDLKALSVIHRVLGDEEAADEYRMRAERLFSALGIPQGAPAEAAAGDQAEDGE